MLLLQASRDMKVSLLGLQADESEPAPSQKVRKSLGESLRSQPTPEKESNTSLQKTL